MGTLSSLVSMQRQSNLHEERENSVESDLHGERIKSRFHEESSQPPCRQLLAGFSWSGILVSMERECRLVSMERECRLVSLERVSKPV